MDIKIGVVKNRDAAINIFMRLRSMFIDTFAKFNSADVKLQVIDNYDITDIDFYNTKYGQAIYCSAFSKYKKTNDDDIEFICDWADDGPLKSTYFMEMCIYEDSDEDRYLVCVIYKPLNAMIKVFIEDDEDKDGEYTVYACNSCADIGVFGLTMEESVHWQDYLTEQQRSDFKDIFELVKNAAFDEFSRSIFRRVTFGENGDD